jgi:hypothetical protein
MFVARGGKNKPHTLATRRGAFGSIRDWHVYNFAWALITRLILRVLHANFVRDRGSPN